MALAIAIIAPLLAVAGYFLVGFWADYQEPSPPVVAQSSAMRYGSGQYAYIGIEGKIYNPNSIPVTNVRVRWQVYETPPPKAGALWARFGYLDSCEVESSLIPAGTTYEFRTGRIKYRDKDTVASLGLTEAPMTDLTPEVTFTTAMPSL